MAPKPKALLRVRQTHSVIGCVEPVRRIVKGLGLKGPNTVVVVPNQPSFRGMIKKVLHLVDVQEVD